MRGLDCLDGTPLIDIKPDRSLFTPLAPPTSGRFRRGRPMITVQPPHCFGRALLLLALAATPAFARTVTDSAGRQVEVPDKITRVFAAGPPARPCSMCLAPQTMIGWVRQPQADEKPFLLPAMRELPQLGRLTGRGNTLNLEGLLADKPDLIIDFGTINDTYRSLADRVQAQTGIPYLLIDGRFENTPAALRLLADVLGVQERGEALAKAAERIFADVDHVLAAVPAAKRPARLSRARPEGPRIRLARLDQHRDHRTRRRHQCRRGLARQRRPRRCFARAGDRLGARHDHHARSRFSAERRSQSELAIGAGRCLRARVPGADPAVRLHRFAAVDKPADRPDLAFAHALSRHRRRAIFATRSAASIGFSIRSI